MLIFILPLPCPSKFLPVAPCASNILPVIPSSPISSLTGALSTVLSHLLTPAASATPPFPPPPFYFAFLFFGVDLAWDEQAEEGGMIPGTGDR
jgi:hypothetical protein